MSRARRARPPRWATRRRFSTRARSSRSGRRTNLGDTHGYESPKDPRDRSRADAEYQRGRGSEDVGTNFFQIQNVRFSLEICGDHGRAEQELAADPPWAPGEGAHVQLLVSHGAYLQAGKHTTGTGGHRLHTDASPQGTADHGAAEVQQAGGFKYPDPRLRVRDHTQLHHGKGSAMAADGMLSAVLPLGGTALPTHAAPAPVPAPLAAGGAVSVPTTPAAVGLPDDIVASS